MKVVTKTAAEGARGSMGRRARALIASIVIGLLGAPGVAWSAPAGAPSELADAGVLVAQPGRQSWDYLFGGVPRDGIAAASIGYPLMPRLEYQHPVAPGYSLGASFSINLAYYVPEQGVNLGMQLTAPMRFSLLNRGGATIGLRFEPGFGFAFEPDFNFAVLGNVGVALGARVSRLVTVGGGIDFPMAIFVDPFIFVLPILFGPMLEVHPTPNLAITADFKMGPAFIAVNNASDVEFALKLAIGAAYRF